MNNHEIRRHGKVFEEFFRRVIRMIEGEPGQLPEHLTVRKPVAWTLVESIIESYCLAVQECQKLQIEDVARLSGHLRSRLHRIDVPQATKPSKPSHPANANRIVLDRTRKKGEDKGLGNG